MSITDKSTVFAALQELQNKDKLLFVQSVLLPTSNSFEGCPVTSTTLHPPHAWLALEDASVLDKAESPLQVVVSKLKLCPGAVGELLIWRHIGTPGVAVEREPVMGQRFSSLTDLLTMKKDKSGFVIPLRGSRDLTSTTSGLSLSDKSEEQVQRAIKELVASSKPERAAGDSKYWSEQASLIRGAIAGPATLEMGGMPLRIYLAIDMYDPTPTMGNIPLEQGLFVASRT
jgi:hypothetical protein